MATLQPADRPLSGARLVIPLAVLVLTACGKEPEPEASAPPPSMRASMPAPSEGISRGDAIAAARDAASDMVPEQWQVTGVTAGQLGHLVPEFGTYDWARDLPADIRIWRVGLASGELRAMVVTDFMDGTVYGVVVGIAN